ncbi:hypothetical protein ACFVUH_04470 [Kitasatospora sp. NPDC058032]|uniref:hypothetical protein n=1 Tax=Kitasatospora sp. NPDC058032 TaxID=3346307 RepID=UPI0036DEF2AA
MLRRLRTAALPIIALAVLTVLAVPGDTAPAPEQSDVPVPGGALERARQVAQAWPGSAMGQSWYSGYFPQREGQFWLPKDFSRNDGAFAAFLGGRIALEAGLPPASGAGTVSFADGTSTALPLTDPRAAYGELVRYRDNPCTREPCDTRLTVTAVRPGTRPQLTSRGTATVPVWEFRFAGLDEPYAVAAVEVESAQKSARYTVPDEDLPTGIADVLLAFHDEKGLEGVMYPHDCADALPGAVYETADVLVLIGRTTGRPTDCEPNGAGRSALFRFTRPLGDRVVLNLAGRPVYFPED